MFYIKIQYNIVMKEYIYDNFAEDSWDYVSEKVVSDDFWDNNLDLIKEITFDLYRLQSMLPLHLQYEPKFVGKVLESVFSNVIKHKIKF